MDPQFDNLVEQFEDALKSDEAPRIEAYLDLVPVNGSDEARKAFLWELIAMEVYYRISRGEPVELSEYSRFGLEASNRAEKALRDGTKAGLNNATLVAPNDEFTPVPRMASENASSVQPVKQIDRYKLLQKIGEGGMGAVWLAEQSEPVKRKVALKLIRPELASKEIIARFEAERQALAMMDHQNIAKVLDAGTTDRGVPYFVMELVKGVPITQYCDDNKLSVDARLELVVQVCRAIQHAHQKGIAHRDLKPSNVLVGLYDGEPIPKVIDFGLAKATEHNMQLTDKTVYTEFGKVVGTIQYMSPEQAGLNEWDVDARTDIYSLGVMLYELLTGSTPLDQATIGTNALMKVLEIIREDDPPRPSTRLSSASHDATTEISTLRQINLPKLQQLLQGDLDWVVMKALERDRTRRYQTANDFGQDIANYLAGETVNARPPSTWYQIQKFAAKHRGLVASMVAIGLALVLGIAGTTFGLVRANQKTAEARHHQGIAEDKTREAEDERENALAAKATAEANEERAVDAEKTASNEAQRARDAEAAAKFQLANARFDANRALEARNLLHQIPNEYRDNFEWRYCNRKFQGSDFTCYGHTSGVFDVVFSPDGRQCASASDDSTIKLWDADTGAEIKTLKGHSGRVLKVAYSPNGKRLASASIDRTVKIWNIESEQAIATLRGHTHLIPALEFSPDGRRLASADFAGVVKLWDAKSGQQQASFQGHGSRIHDLDFSPDGQTLATSSEDTKVVMWDLRNNQRIKTLADHRTGVNCVQFSPDGKYLVSSSHQILIWDLHSGEVRGTQANHLGKINCIALSPDGSRIVSASDDSTLKLIETHSGNVITTLTGHGGAVQSVAFSPDGERLASASYDKTVKIWSAESEQEITLNGDFDVTFSSDGKRFASPVGNGLSIWNWQTGQQLITMNGHKFKVEAVAFSPDGQTVASASGDTFVHLWDVQSGKLLTRLGGHRRRARDVVFHPDGKQLASCSDDGTIKIWDSQSGKEMLTLKGHTGGIYKVKYSPDGKLIASCSRDKTVRLWDAKTGKGLATLRGHNNAVRTIAFDPSGKRLASAGLEYRIRIWDIESSREIASMDKGILAPVYDLAFSSDGKRLASTASGSVRLWDTDSGKEVVALATGVSVYGVDFSPDGSCLAAACHGEKIKLFDTRSMEEAIVLSGHKAVVNSVQFNEDGTLIYSQAGKEKFVWNRQTRQLLNDDSWNPPAEPRQTSPDGRWLVTTESNHIVLVDRQFKDATREKAYRHKKAMFDADWHWVRAKTATAEQDWYAATFHLACLSNNEPDRMELRKGLQSAYQRLKSSYIESGPLAYRLRDTVGGHDGKIEGSIGDIESRLQRGPSIDSVEDNSNKAIHFDGSSFARLSNPPFCQGSFTVEAWVKPERTKSNKAIFNVRAGVKNTAAFAEFTKGGTVRAVFRNPPGNIGGLEIQSKSKINDGNWHHFAVVKSEDGKLRLFIDGDLDATSSGKLDVLGDKPFSVILGHNHEGDPRNYVGLIDEVRLWNVARTEKEIKRDFKRILETTSKGLVAYYQFDSWSEKDAQERIQPFLAPVVRDTLK